MAPPLLHVLSEAEKNDLLLAQHEMIERMAARISELAALLDKPRKTSKNSHNSALEGRFDKGRSRGGKRLEQPLAALIHGGWFVGLAGLA